MTIAATPPRPMNTAGIASISRTLGSALVGLESWYSAATVRSFGAVMVSMESIGNASVSVLPVILTAAAGHFRIHNLVS